MRRTEYINTAGLRQDGRRPKELRRLQCRFGVVPKADGSVYYEQGLTRVIAVVNGPREVRRLFLVQKSSSHTHEIMHFQIFWILIDAFACARDTNVGGAAVKSSS